MSRLNSVQYSRLSTSTEQQKPIRVEFRQMFPTSQSQPRTSILKSGAQQIIKQERLPSLRIESQNSQRPRLKLIYNPFIQDISQQSDARTPESEDRSSLVSVISRRARPRISSVSNEIHIEDQNKKQLLKRQSASTLKHAHRRLKHYVQFIIAALRLSHNLRHQKFHPTRQILNHCESQLKWKSNLATVRIKQWASMVVLKSLSMIQRNPENLCYIVLKSKFTQDRRLNPKTLDYRKLKLTNYAKLIFQNLEAYTQKDYFPVEGIYLLNSQLFSQSRKTFSNFVSSRTQYLSPINCEIPLTEVALIFSEFIFYHIADAIIRQDMIYKPDPSNIIETFKPQFLLSCLQYYFKDYFEAIPTQRHGFPTQIKAFVCNEEISLLPLKSNSDEYITGLFSEEQLQIDPLSDQKFRLYFSRSLVNLTKFKIRNKV